MTQSASVINSGVHSFQMFLGSQKLHCFFNFPISHASYKKLFDCYWLQLRITCKSGWIAQAEKDTASANKEAKVRLLHRRGQSQVLPCRLCYPLLPLVMYRSNRSFNIPPPPRQPPGHLTFSPLPGPKCRSNAPHYGPLR